MGFVARNGNVVVLFRIRDGGNVGAADDDDEEGVSENKLANQRRIIESCNVLERSVMMEGRVLIQLELMWMGLKAQWM